MPIASYPVTGHHWEESASVISTSSLQVFTDTGKILPEPPLLQVEQPQLSACPRKGRRSSPSMAFLALPWALSSASPLPCSGEPTLDTCSRHSFVSTQQRERITALLAPLLLAQPSLEPGQLLGSCTICESWNIKTGIALRTPTQHSWRDWPMLCDKATSSYVGKCYTGQTKSETNFLILKAALWTSSLISRYYYFQQVLVKWFMKSNITENPHCTRHGSLDSGSWSLAGMKLSLLTAPPRQGPPAHPHRLHDLFVTKHREKWDKTVD